MKKTETKSTVLLQHHLKVLKLPTMLSECTKVAIRCASENVDHLGFLLQLCELELIDRDRRAADRRLKAAKFPTHKTLDTFDFKAQPSVNKLLITELARGEYIDKRENLLLVGNSGTGKSHLAIALGITACGQGKRVRFIRVTELITQLLEAREDRELMRLKKQLTKLDLLILDELGYVPATKVGSELLFISPLGECAEGRHQHGLRTDESDRHHQLALRELDRSPRQRTTDRGDTRSPHTPLSHPRSQW